LTASRQANVKWKEIIKVVKQELATLSFKPTLRTMFYRLVSKPLIANTNTTYKSLGHATVEARMDGRLPIACFADNSRQVVGDWSEDYWTPEQVIDHRINELWNTENDYEAFIPMWHNQPHYVEIWTEKDAMVGTFQSILEEHYVRIVPMRGFSSLTFLYETVQRLKRLQIAGKSIHILYYGDFDPSGDYMDTDLQKRMRKMKFNINKNGGSFERIAVTPKHIEQHKLPYNPDEVTTKKLMENDNRTNGFLKKYGKLYAVEIDALPALIPDVFKQELVIDMVEKYYDKDIYQKLVDKYLPSDINRQVRESVLRKMQEDAD
jgi:hypothetical protein